MKLSYNVDIKVPEKSDLSPNISEETRAMVMFVENKDQLSMCMEFSDRRAKSVTNKLKAYAKRKGYAVEVFNSDNCVYVVKKNIAE